MSLDLNFDLFQFFELKFGFMDIGYPFLYGSLVWKIAEEPLHCF